MCCFIVFHPLSVMVYVCIDWLQCFKRLLDPEIKRIKNGKKIGEYIQCQCDKDDKCVLSLVSGLSISSYEFFKFSIDINHSLQLDTATFYLFPFHGPSSLLSQLIVSLNNNSTKISINRN